MIKKMMISSGNPRLPMVHTPPANLELAICRWIVPLFFGGLAGFSRGSAELVGQSAPVTFSSGVNLVEVYATVTDRDGAAGHRPDGRRFPGH